MQGIAASGTVAPVPVLLVVVLRDMARPDGDSDSTRLVLIFVGQLCGNELTKGPETIAGTSLSSSSGP